MQTNRTLVALFSCGLLFALMLAAQTAAPVPIAPIVPMGAGSPLPREAQLEFQLLDARAKEITEKVQALFDLLMNPIIAARSAAVIHACNLVGIAPTDSAGKPTCQVKDGMVVSTAPTPAAASSTAATKPEQPVK